MGPLTVSHTVGDGTFPACTRPPARSSRSWLEGGDLLRLLPKQQETTVLCVPMTLEITERIPPPAPSYHFGRVGQSIFRGRHACVQSNEQGDAAPDLSNLFSPVVGG